MESAMSARESSSKDYKISIISILIPRSFSSPAAIVMLPAGILPEFHRSRLHPRAKAHKKCAYGERSVSTGVHYPYICNNISARSFPEK